MLFLWLWPEQPLAHLAVEGGALLGFDELTVGLVGSDNDSGHGFLVLRGGRGEQGERSEGNVILAVGQAALVITVWAEAGEGKRQWEYGENNLQAVQSSVVVHKKKPQDRKAIYFSVNGRELNKSFPPIKRKSSRTTYLH